MGGNGRRAVSFRSSSIGSRLNVYAKLPTHLNGSSPAALNGANGAGGARAAAGAAAERRRDVIKRSLCAAVVALPWLVLLLLFAGHSWRSKHGQLPVSLVNLPGAKQCVGWRETIFCHPFT